MRDLAQLRYFTAVLLVLIIGFAALLRLSGNNWDDGQHIHPDERFLTFVQNGTELPDSLGEYFNSEQSPMNPYNRGFGDFFYGTFPLFSVRIVAEVLDKTDYGNINLVGRFMAGLFDVGSVLLVFLLGRRLYGRNVGLLAAFLLAVTVLNIQHAHFFVVESFLTFFSLLTVYYSVRIAQEGGWRNYGLAGLALGFALASKLSALPLLGIIGLAAVIHTWPVLVSAWEAAWRRMKRVTVPHEPTLSELNGSAVGEPYPPIGRAVIGLLGAVFVAFLVFRIAQPYAFTSTHLPIIEWFHFEGGLSQNFVDDLEGIRNLQEGKADSPPSIVWIGRTPYVFALKNMVLWGMGPALGLAAWGGVLFALWRTIRHRESTHLLLLVWVLGTFGYAAGAFSSAMRYLLPIYPQMVLLAAFGLISLWNEGWIEGAAQRLGRLRRYAAPALPVVAKGALIGTVALTALWAVAFTNIYRQPLSRLEASEWIYDNVPAGAAIGKEHWDDPLPFNLPDGRNQEIYPTVEFTNYDDDSLQKLSQLVARLDEADYVVLSSNRLYGSIPQVPTRYPMSIVYYDLLFQERLGFEIAATFTSYPSLLGIEIPDQAAEEAFTVYDHPKVTIFKKTADYDSGEVAALLYAARPESAVHLVPGEAATNGLILGPQERETQQNGGTWSKLFDPDSPTNRFPLITWLLVVELAALALVPLAVIFFRRLPDGGYLLTKPLAILVLAYPVWLGASLGIFHFTRGSALAVLLLLMLAGGLAAYRMRERLGHYIRQHWRLILFGEALFLIAFLAFYFVRLENPDLWHAARGGEKPMDFAYLNAITRSTTLPPYDPWFAGGYINYYYFGHFMTANLVKLTGIVPEVAYNLAVPLFFAVGVSAAFSVGYNLAETSRRLLRRRPGGLPIPAWTTVLAGLTAVFLVVLAGNLKSADVMIDRLEVVSPWHTGVPVLDSVLAITLGGAKVIFGSAELGRYDYWEPSRAIITDPNNNAITEFPSFTFLFADLHAHLMAIPYTLLSLGLGLALVLNASPERAHRRERSPVPWREWLPTVGLVIVLALVVGALRWINSWDYPTFLIMALAVLFIAEWARGGIVDVLMLRRTALLGALLGLLSLAFFQPFSSHYALPATGFQGMPSELPRTPFDQYLSHFGLFIFLVGSLLTFLSYRVIRRRGAGRFFMALVWTVLGIFAATTLIVGLAGPAARVIPGITITDLSARKFLEEIVGNDIPVAVFSLFALAVVVILLWREFRTARPDGPLRLVVLGFIAMAFVLSTGVEIAVLNPDIGRQNTVFKFYLQIWILLALASSFAVWYLAAALAPRLTSLRERLLNIRLGASAGLLRPVFLVVLVVLLLGASAYPLEATQWRVRLDDRASDATRQDGKLVAAGGNTNNGMAFMQRAVYQDGDHTIELKYDYDAMMWLRNRVEGSPVIMEAVTPEYRWGSRYAIYTGLPSVVGWRFHQTQQRGRFAPMVEARIPDVDRFYSTTEVGEAESILHKYDVSYVIVGQVERNYYPAEGIAKFESMAKRSLQPVYHNDLTVIYHVVGTVPPRLASTNPTP